MIPTCQDFTQFTVHTLYCIFDIFTELMEVPQAFGQVICKARQSKGFSQLLLSEKADLHLNTVQAIESGKHNPKITTVFKLAAALDQKAGELMNQVEAKTPSFD